MNALALTQGVTRYVGKILGQSGSDMSTAPAYATKDT